MTIQYLNYYNEKSDSNESANDTYSFKTAKLASKSYVFSDACA